MVLTPAAIGANVEAGPIVDHRRDHRGRGCFHGHIGGGRRCGQANGSQANRSHKKLLHRVFLHLGARPLIQLSRQVQRDRE